MKLNTFVLTQLRFNSDLPPAVRRPGLWVGQFRQLSPRPYRTLFSVRLQRFLSVKRIHRAARLVTSSTW